MSTIICLLRIITIIAVIRGIPGDGRQVGLRGLAIGKPAERRAGTYLIPEDIDDTIQRSLHLGHAREDSLSHTLYYSRDAGAMNDCLYTGSIGSLISLDRYNSRITIIFRKR